MTKIQHLLVLLSVLLVIAACGGDDEPSQPKTTPPPTDTAAVDTSTPQPTPVPALTVSTNDPDSWVAGIDTPTAGLMRLPTIDNAGGRLVFTQSTTLYIAAFDNQRAQRIAELVNPYSLSRSPSGSHIAYLTTLTYQDIPNAIQMLDTLSLETTTLLAVNTPNARIVGWSPDGAWVAISAPEQLTLVEVATQSVQELLIPSANAPRLAPHPIAAWLTDNRLLYTLPAPPDQLSVVAYDPTTQASTSLDITLSASQPVNWGALAVQVGDQDLALVPNPNLASNTAAIQQPQAVWNFAPTACDTWSIQLENRTLYQVNDAAFLSHINALPDEHGMLFLAWRLPMCSTGSHMQLWLLRLQNNGAVELVTDRILPEGTRDLALLLGQQSERYTLTPDGRYVIWVAGSEWSEHASIEITDLHTGQHGVLIQVAAPSPVNLFTNVVWIPTDG